jgi:cell cycle arrest protein BUB3
MESGPLLSLAVPSPSPSGDTSQQQQQQQQSVLVTGGLDGSVKVFDITSSSVQLLGRHTVGSSPQKSGAGKNDNNSNDDDVSEIIRPGVSCLAAVGGNYPNLIASASWSRQLCLWDLRSSSSSSSSSPVAKVTLPGKAFSMDVDPVHDRIMVATSGRYNCFFDIRTGTGGRSGGGDEYGQHGGLKLESILQRESSLKFQTRAVRFFETGDSFCISSIEGRVGVEYLDDIVSPPADAVGEKRKKYAFKCHRVNDTVYPVNVLACHPKFQTVFATGGCDGTVVLWDAQLKKKLTSLPKFLTSISALVFSYDESTAATGRGKDATELAIASSYTYEEGDREHPQGELYVRQILDSECEPKK